MTMKKSKIHNKGKRKKLWLRRIGIGIAIVIGVGFLVLIVVDGTFLPKKYLEPWDESYSKQFDDPRIQVIAHGLLAPNAHNLQSWKISLDKENPLEFTLFLDSERLLPGSDPFSRQITVSQGTFLEYARIGAAKMGYKTDITLFPEREFDAEGTPASMDTHSVARVTLEKATPEDDPLYDAITAATAKTPLLDTPLTPEEIESLQSLNTDPDLTVLIFQNEEDLEKIKKLAIDGMAIELGLMGVLQERGEPDVFRFTEWQKNRFRNGLTMEPFIPSKIKRFLMQALGRIIPVSEEKMRDIGQKEFEKAIAPTPAFIMVLSRGNNRTVQVKAGMLYARFELTGTVMGINMGPMSQVLEEFPEMAELYEDVHKTFADQDQTIQMLAAMGKLGKKVSRSPRRDVLDLIIE